MVLPPHGLTTKVIDTIRTHTHAMARELRVCGLMNVQYAVKEEVVYVLAGLGSDPMYQAPGIAGAIRRLFGR